MGHNGIKILLVEDEAITALLGMQLLKSVNYEVYHVSSGEAAIEFVRAQIHPIDLILMDIDLGSGIDGTTAAERILQFYNIPILFHSSHTEAEVVSKTENITSYGYVVKNSGITVLNASIKMALKLFRAHEELAQKKIELYSSLEELQASNEQLLAIEAELHKSEEKFSKAFESNPAILFITRTEDGKIFDVNETWTRVTGYSKSESTGKTTVELGIISHKKRIKLKERLYKEKTVRDVELIMLDKFGNKKYLLLSAVLVTINQEYFTLGSAIDVTDNILANHHLAEKNLEFESVFQFLSDLFFRASLDGTIVKFIAGSKSSLLDPSLSFVGKKINETLPEPSSFKLEKAIQKSISEKTQEVVEYSLEINNQEIHYEAMISPINDFEIVAVARDISQRKNHEREIIKLNILYNFIRNINKLLIRVSDTKKLFNEICRISVEDGDFSFAWVGIIENSKIHESICFEKDSINQNISLNKDFLNLINITNFNSNIYYSNDMKNDPKFKENGSEFIPSDYKSAIILPFIVQGELKAFANLFSSEKDFFDPSNLKLFEEIREDISFVLEKIWKANEN